MSSIADTAHPVNSIRLAELSARCEELARRLEADLEPVIEHYDRVYEEPVPESVVADQHAALARMSPGARRLHAELTADGKAPDDDPWWTDEDGNRHRGPCRSDATRRTLEYARIHREGLARTGMGRAHPEHAVRALERYLYRASMRSRAGGLEQAIHGPPSPDDFGIPTAHLVTATVAPCHAGPSSR